MGIRRSRPTSVCQKSRSRKVKCDKAVPCSHCAKLGHQCVYMTSPPPDYDVKPRPKLQKTQSSGLQAPIEPPFGSVLDPSLVPAPVPGPDPVLAPVPDRPDDIPTPLDLLEAQVDALENDIRLEPFVKSPINSKLAPKDPTLYPDTPSTRVSVSNLMNEEPMDMVNLIQFYNSRTPASSAPKRRHGLLSGASVLQASLVLAALYDGFNNGGGKHRFINSFAKKSDKLETPKPAISEPGITRLGKPEIAASLSVDQLVANKTQPKDSTPHVKLLGLMFEGDIEHKIKLLTKIKAILPPRKVIALLLTRFFSKVYPYFPVLDQGDFTANIDRILGPAGPASSPALNVERKLDFAYLGILLIVLRFAHLSIFSNVQAINKRRFDSTNQESHDWKLLVQNPVHLEAFSVAQVCLNQFNLISCPNLVVLQLVMFIRYYKVYAPEYGDEAEPGDPLVFSALIIRLATSLGLHRDPDQFKYPFSPEEKNLRRRIWLGIKFLDMYSCLGTGGPCNTELFPTDVMAPVVPEDSKAFVFEVTLADFMKTFPDIFATMYKVLRVISNEEEVFSIKKVDKMMEQCFNAFLVNAEEKISRVMAPEMKPQALCFYKTFKLRCYFLITRAILVLRYHFCNYYCLNNCPSAVVDYMKKVLSLLYTKTYPVIHELLTNSSRQDDDVCDLILTPGLHSVLYAGITINLAFLVRVKTVLASGFYLDIGFSLTLFETLLTEATSSLIGYLTVLGNRNYCAWRDAKLLRFLFDEISGGNLDHSELPETCALNNANLQEMCDMIKYGLGYSTSHSYGSGPITGAGDSGYGGDSGDSLWMLIISLRRNDVNYEKFGEDKVEDVAFNMFLEEMFNEFFR